MRASLFFRKEIVWIHNQAHHIGIARQMVIRTAIIESYFANF